MKKEFKKNVGDKVWVMYNNRPLSCQISAINYGEFISSISFELEKFERYTVKFDDEYVDQFELKDIYDTKEDLIKSL